MLNQNLQFKYTNSRLSAGASGRGVTPVSIPNTEVKPPCAYGTAGFPGGRVGRCRRSIVSLFSYYMQSIILSKIQARSSVGEHYLDTVGVGGSIPPAPTNNLLNKRESS